MRLWTYFFENAKIATSQLRIYPIQNAEIKYGYEFIAMQKAKIKHNLGFIPYLILAFSTI